MVTLRRSTRRTNRTSSSSIPTPPPSSQPIPAAISANQIHSSQNPSIPTPIPTIPSSHPSLPTPSSFLIPELHNQSFDLGGIQYSPYFLTSGDNPGISLITEVLDGSNYNTWNIAMTIALDAKNKIAFVDGSLPRLDESHPHYRLWSRCNSMVKSWILNAVTKPIYGSILRFNDASEIWKDLMTRFHITNLPRSYQLTQQIWSLHQGALDLSSYYTKLKTLWDDLDRADFIKTCQTCTCCKATAKKTEHTKVIKFLAGLNESYSNARSQSL